MHTDLLHKKTLYTATAKPVPDLLMQYMKARLTRNQPFINCITQKKSHFAGLFPEESPGTAADFSAAAAAHDHRPAENAKPTLSIPDNTSARHSRPNLHVNNMADYISAFRTTTFEGHRARSFGCSY